MCSGHLQCGHDPTPPGNSDGYQNKGLAGKAARKTMKTKGEQFALQMNHAQYEGYPHPRVFCEKSPQTIENKRRERQKEGKERKRVRKLVATQDLLGLTGKPSAGVGWRRHGVHREDATERARRRGSSVVRNQ